MSGFGVWPGWRPCRPQRFLAFRLAEFNTAESGEIETGGAFLPLKAAPKLRLIPKTCRLAMLNVPFQSAKRCVLGSQTHRFRPRNRPFCKPKWHKLKSRTTTAIFSCIFASKGNGQIRLLTKRKCSTKHFDTLIRKLPPHSRIGKLYGNKKCFPLHSGKHLFNRYQPFKVKRLYSG